MDIQNIRAFLMVTETGSFSRAAEKLFITQPAISKRIATLEFALNCKLFDRLGKTVQLTQAGKAIMPSYLRIVAEMGESQRIISSLRTQVSGQLKFGSSHHIGLYRLPPILRRYSEQYPDVELDIQFMDSEQAGERILKGNIELALITLPDNIEKPLITLPMWTDHMHCVVAHDHVLSKQKNISTKNLFLDGVILQPHGTHTRDIIDRALKLDTSVKIIMESNYLETIKAMIQHGLGWGVLPESMIDNSLHKLSIKGVSMERHLGLLQHQSRTLSSSANALLATLKD